MKTLSAVVAGALVAASVMGGVGSAVGTDATLYACVHNKAQTIKMTTAGRACPNGYTKLSWNTQGPKGDTGAQGVKGDTGAPGPQGSSAPMPTTYSVSVFNSLDLTGLSASAYCHPGDTATGGGVRSSLYNNTTVRESFPILDVDGKPVGWKGEVQNAGDLTVAVLCVHFP